MGALMPGLAPGPEQALSVSQVTQTIKHAVEGTPELQDVWVRGEVSNYKHHSSGHRYFSLKDDAAVLRAVMFERHAREQAAVWGPLPPDLGDGVEVVAHGYVGVYGKSGQYQLYVDVLIAAGAGSLHLALERLKAKLAAEGLFDAARKRPLPRLPRRVAVVTSPSGAAVRDIIRVARRRFPNIEIVVVPVAVQGETAPDEIAEGLRRANDPALRADVIIVGRGGGSLEDLWAFNDERVARAIAASRLPVVSAVGHETDFTIADLVADLRAPTPSAAAEIVVPDRAELERRLKGLAARLASGLRRMVKEDRRRLALLRARTPLRRPLWPILTGRQRIDELRAALVRDTRAAVDARRRRLEHAAGRLQALSPLAVLARGYAVAQKQDGTVIRSAAQVELHEAIEVILAEGALQCEVWGAGPGLSDAARETRPRTGAAQE